MSVYVYASVCDFVCIALHLQYVLGYCLSFFLFLFLFFKYSFYHLLSLGICFLVWLLSSFFLSFLKKFFYYLQKFFLIIIFYFNNFILLYITLFYFILSSSFFLIFSPFYSELCGGQALGAPARRQDCASEVGEPSSGHWSTRDLPAPRDIKQ